MKRSLIAQLASAIVAALAADNATAQDVKRDPPAATAPTTGGADYWTREKMLSAQPAEMGRANGPSRIPDEDGRTNDRPRTNTGK